jgi:hypothetical protein
LAPCGNGGRSLSLTGLCYSALVIGILKELSRLGLPTTLKSTFESNQRLICDNIEYLKHIILKHLIYIQAATVTVNARVEVGFGTTVVRAGLPG